jgi:hypothetical protein
MILSTSLDLEEDDTLDTKSTNGVDAFNFSDFVLLLILLLHSILAIAKIPLSILICQFVCKNRALLICHESCRL